MIGGNTDIIDIIIDNAHFLDSYLGNLLSIAASRGDLKLVRHFLGKVSPDSSGVLDEVADLAVAEPHGNYLEIAKVILADPRIHTKDIAKAVIPAADYVIYDLLDLLIADPRFRGYETMLAAQENDDFFNNSGDTVNLLLDIRTISEKLTPSQRREFEDYVTEKGSRSRGSDDSGSD